MKIWVGIEGRKISWNILCRGMNVRMWVTCYESVQHIIVPSVTFMKQTQELLENY